MIKIIGAIILVGAAAVLGFSAAANLNTRERVLSGFSRALDIMHSEIGQYLTPLDELMSKLSGISPVPLDGFFKQCFEEMKNKPDTPFRFIWVKNIKHADYLRLRGEETEVIAALGNVLGRYSAEEQKLAIEHASRCVESMSQSASRDRKRLGGFYAKLGIICGIAVVIVFI
ncbi:MAG: stage III sporulation protein AB [Oscillospiraceae bacterium]|nr:stage III sporulation protein AB [Oscillospiraceae bacterium]